MQQTTWAAALVFVSERKLHISPFPEQRGWFIWEGRNACWGWGLGGQKRPIWKATTTTKPTMFFFPHQSEGGVSLPDS